MARRPMNGMESESLWRQNVERRLRAIESGTRLQSASIGSGGIRVKDDGSIQFLADDGTTILEIDKSAFTFDRANGVRQLEITPAGGLKVYAANGTTERVVVDGDGLDVGGGLTVVDETGLTVGTDVVIDSTGLSIDGVLQPALANLTASDTSNPTVTNTMTTVNSIVFTIPSWADEVTLVTFARLVNLSAPSGDTFLVNRLTNDVGGLDEQTDDQIKVQASGLTQNSSFVALTSTVTLPGSTITCNHGARSISTSVACEARIEGIAIVRRTS